MRHEAMNQEKGHVGGGNGLKTFANPTNNDEDFSSCTVGQLLSHSSWKARKEGYERVQREPEKHLSTILENLKCVSTEGNAIVQEAAIEALVDVLHQCNDGQRSQLAEGTVKAVVEKGITGRPKAVQLSQQFIFALVEGGDAGVVFDALLPAFAHKTPKSRLAAVQTAAALVSDYGVQHFPLKGILTAMQPLFNDAAAPVRKEAATLCCQCYRYIGANIKGYLTDLRDVQLQELQKQFESVKVGEKPPKSIRGVSALPGRGNAGSSTVVKPIGSLTGDSTDVVADDAGFELLDESPVIPKLPKKFFRVALDKNTTWQDRVEYVNEHLSPLLSAPRYRAKDDYHDLASMMKEYLIDPQAPLMLLGFKMIQECARGLRSDFAAHAKLYVAPLLDKMKDKKVSVQLHVMKTLEDLICFNCISMDQCNDEFDQGLQSKNPTQRAVVLGFLIRMIDSLGDRSRFVKLGRSTAMLTRAVNDEKASIRDVAYVLLDRLIRAFGDAQFKNVLASLDDNQRHNMAAAVARNATMIGSHAGASKMSSDSSSPKCLGTAGTTPFNSPAKKIPRVEDSAMGASSAPGYQSHPRPAPAAGPSSAARRTSASGTEGTAEAPSVGLHGTEMQHQSSSLPRHSVASTTSIVSASEKVASRNRTSVPRSSVSDQNGIAGISKISVEDAVVLESALPTKMDSVTSILGLLEGDDTVLDMVRSREWARRQEGVNKLLLMIQQWTRAQATRHLEHLVVYLRAHPSFREPIFQVFNIMTQILLTTLMKVAALSAAAGYALVSGFTPRLSESKNGPLVRDVCSAVAGRLGQRFVVRHMLDTTAMAKTPKLLQEVCEYVREVIQQQPDNEETGREAVEAKGVLHFVKTVCADFNNAAVRQEAVLLLVALRRSPHASSAAVERCVASLQPPLPALFERELHRVESGTPPAVALLPAKGSVTSSKGLPPTATATAVQTSPASKRVRTLSQSPGSGANTSVEGSLLSNRQSEHRRSLSDPEVLLMQRKRTPSLGRAGSATRGTVGRTNSVGPSPRSSFTSNVTPSATLRSIIREITSGKDWRDRLNGIRQAEAFVRETPCPLPANCAVPLLKAMQGRFEEANKNLVVDVLRFIPVVVEAAGHEECCGALRQLTPGVLAMLGDQKTSLREEARNVAFLAMKVVGLESLLPLLQRPLSSESNACRQNVLEMMVSGFEQLPADATLPRAGMQLLIPPVISSIMDRLLDVRLIAEQVLGWMIGVVGEDAVMQSVHKLRPAEQQAVMPAVERQIELHQRTKAEEKQSEESQVQQPSSAKALASHRILVADPLENEEGRRTPSRSVTSQASQLDNPCAANGVGAATPACHPVTITPHHAHPRTAGQQNGGNGSAATVIPVPMAERESDSARHPKNLEVSKTQVEPPIVSSKHGKNGAVVGPPGVVDVTAAPTVIRVPSSKLSAGKSTVTPSTTATTKRSPLSSTDVSLLAEGRDELYTVRDILAGLRSAPTDVAVTMCADVKRHLLAGVDCGTPELVQAMVERLYEQTQHFDKDLAMALIECLTNLFMTPRSAMRCHNQLLFRMTGLLFDCLLSENFSVHESVVKALNVTTLRLLEGCPTDEVFSALLSRLSCYSTAYLAHGHKIDFKFIQVTVKCVMRIDFAKVGANATVLSCHEYLLQHPPSAFRNLDDLPIRTVKTILQTATKRHGLSFLDTAEKLVGPENLVTHFIRACLDLNEKAAKVKGQNEQQVIEESQQERRASQSPAPTSAKENALPGAHLLRPPSTTAAASPTAGTDSMPAAVTPGKRATTPSRRKMRASNHVDPTDLTPSTPITASHTTAMKASTSNRSSQIPSSTPTRAGGTPAVKVPPRQSIVSVSSGEGHGTSAATPLADTPAPVVPPSVMADNAVDTSTSVHDIGGAVVCPRDVKKDLTEIFAHIRNHLTSSKGIDELYVFLKGSSPSSYEDAFRLQFNRCSEAFRLYIKRKLERKVEEDSARSPTFRLPMVVRDLS